MVGRLHFVLGANRDADLPDADFFPPGIATAAGLSPGPAGLASGTNRNATAPGFGALVGDCFAVCTDAGVPRPPTVRLS
jgi:hypothetical protein